MNERKLFKIGLIFDLISKELTGHEYKDKNKYLLQDLLKCSNVFVDYISDVLTFDTAITFGEFADGVDEMIDELNIELYPKISLYASLIHEEIKNIDTKHYVCTKTICRYKHVKKRALECKDLYNFDKLEEVNNILDKTIKDTLK